MRVACATSLTCWRATRIGTSTSPRSSTPSVELAALMTRRRQLVDMRVAETNRLEQAASARAVRSIKSLLRTLDKQIADIDRDADDFLDLHFKEQRKVLDSAKGVGPVTILTLTSALP